MDINRGSGALQRVLLFGFEPPKMKQEHARITRWAEAMIADGLSLCFAQGETMAEQKLSRTSEVLRSIGRYLVSHYIDGTIRWVGEPRSYPARMAPVILKESSIGISTYWEHTTMAIHSHDIDEKSLALYSRTGGDAAWFHTPFDDNEAITEIWWGSIGGNAMDNHRIYYDSMSSMGIGGLAFEDPSPVAQGFQPFDPTTIVPPMPDFRYCVEPFFFSSANLHNLSKITVCQIPDKRIIDEHPRLVEISFSPIEPIMRDGTDPAVVGINCLEVLFADELHWWWSSLQCQVFYDVQGSLQPRDAEKWLLFDDYIVRTSKGREICDAHAPRLHETSWGLADHFQGSERTMYYGSDAPVGVGAIVVAVPPPRGLETNLTHSQRCLRFPASDTSLVERSCTSSSGTIPPGLYLITRTSSTRASSGDEPPEDLNPESHPDITGQRFLEVSWEGSLEWWWSPLKGQPRISICHSAARVRCLALSEELLVHYGIEVEDSAAKAYRSLTDRRIERRHVCKASTSVLR
ncbi:hypothetical protein H9L39_10858, partial [Fusarium oxysporum f. sp. albedinis]